MEHVDSESSEHGSSQNCFLYDPDVRPTWIESVFGEPYHVKDKYAQHRISLRFVLTLSSVYIVEGCLDWLMIAARYYGTATWNIGPSDMQSFRSIVAFPWTIKLCYGLLIDCVPLCGYKRKSYMFVLGIAAVCSMLAAITFAQSYAVQLLAFTLNQLCVAFCDVIADALCVERTEFKSHTVATRLQALSWGSRYIASIAGLLVSTHIEESNEPRDMLVVYWLYLFVTCLMPLSAVLLPEQKHIPAAPSIEKEHLTDSMIMQHTQNYSVKEILYLTFQSVCRKCIFYPLAFVMLLALTPTSREPIDYFLIYKLGFSSVYIGYLSVAGGVAFLISIAIITYQSRASNNTFSLRRVSLVWTLMACFLPFLTLVLVFGWNKKLGIPNFYFMASDQVIVSVALDMTYMATLVLLARMCPPGIEGTFMTVLSSLANLGGIISLQISSGITSLLGIECKQDPADENSVLCDFSNLWLLIVIVNLSTLLPLILIKRVPDEHELLCIAEELKQASTLLDNQSEDRSRMVVGYGWIMDYVVPCAKKVVCRRCCKASPTQNEKEMELVVNSKDVELISSQMR